MNILPLLVNEGVNPEITTDPNPNTNNENMK